ncbi:MAG TPA: carboxylating nicotinate-nucleotide diphosphorylase [Candidatus Kapabacteria bacterium]|nr:carboxylating nicotinate-nucleotide diphosphorylase [Candidatus Kapabacteria bacterium]
MQPLSDIERQRIRIALVEDGGREDVTSLATVDENADGMGTFIAKADGVVAGLEIARHTFSLYEVLHGIASPEFAFEATVSDGERVQTGDSLGTLRARLRTLLAAERVALNFLQRMSGIATMTRAFVDAVAGTGAVILDTRKTAPLLRPFDRQAVRAGGGTNHRYGLGDMVLIKDNHIAANDGDIERVLAKLKDFFANPERAHVPVEIEVTSLDEFETILRLGTGIIDRVLFDNFDIELLREGVRLNHGTFETEASGGITLETARAVAETGVHFLSVGALTHSVRALDISFEIEPMPS